LNSPRPDVPLENEDIQRTSPPAPEPADMDERRQTLTLRLLSREVSVGAEEERPRPTPSTNVHQPLQSRPRSVSAQNFAQALLREAEGANEEEGGKISASETNNDTRNLPPPPRPSTTCKYSYMIT